MVSCLDILFLCAMTCWKSTETFSARMPSSAPWCLISSSSSALRSRHLVGMHPTFRQVLPKCRFLFSSPSPDAWAHMLAGSGSFQNVDHLLVTHSHMDHFSADMMRRYLEARQVKGVILPATVTPTEQELIQYMERERIPFSILHPHTVLRWQLGEVTVSAIPTRHLDRMFWDVPHFCYLISFARERVLVTADADYTRESFSSGYSFAGSAAQSAVFPCTARSTTLPRATDGRDLLHLSCAVCKGWTYAAAEYSRVGPCPLGGERQPGSPPLRATANRRAISRLPYRTHPNFLSKLF